MAKYIVLISAILILTACNNPSINNLELEDYTLPEDVINEIEVVLPWQQAYAKLLREYEEKGDLYFLLYDFDKDGTPELIVIGILSDESCDAVYTFRNGKTLALEYEEDVFSADSVLYARGGVTAAPGDAPGLIDYYIGPSAGAFGTSTYFTRIVLDGDRLMIDARGSIYVDVKTLNELFENFGRDTDDYASLSEAIQKHTHYYINDNAVTEEELYSTFVNEERLSSLRITETAIREIIFQEGGAE